VPNIPKVEHRSFDSSLQPVNTENAADIRGGCEEQHILSQTDSPFMTPEKNPNDSVWLGHDPQIRAFKFIFCLLEPGWILQRFVFIVLAILIFH